MLNECDFVVVGKSIFCLILHLTCLISWQESDYNSIYLFPGLLQSDEFWLLESSSSSRDVPIDDIAADTTVSVGLRGSLPDDTLLFIAVVVVEVAKKLVHVVEAINFCGSIGSICNGKERRKRRKRRK